MIQLKEGQIIIDRAGREWITEKKDILVERSNYYLDALGDLSEGTTYYSYAISWYDDIITENEEPTFFYSIEDAVEHAKEFIQNYNFDDAFTEDARLTVYPYYYDEDYEEWEIGDTVYKEKIPIEGFLSLNVDMAKDIIEDIEEDLHNILLKYYSRDDIDMDVNFSRVSESSYINIRAGNETYKVRVSTHQLPDKYEQPDLEIRFDSSYLTSNNTLDKTMVEKDKKELYRDFERLIRKDL